MRSKLNDSMTNGMGKTKLRAYLGHDTKDDSMLFATNFRFAYSFLFLRAMGHAMEEKRFFIVLAVALPVVYGGVHLTAWGFEFPTAAELLWWKVACFIIIGTVSGIVSTSAMIDPCFRDTNHWPERKTLEGLYRIFCISALAVYGCARLYIVVESFLSLRSVPIGVYYTPSWLQIIPHA